MRRTTRVLLVLVSVFLMTMGVQAASTSFEGDIEFAWTNSDLFSSSYSSKIVYDFKRDFGNGLSAGLGIKVSPDEDFGQFTYDWGGWATMDFDDYFVAVNSWIDDFSTANYMGDGYPLPGGPGVSVDFKQIPNVVVNTHLGSFGKWTADDPDDPDSEWSEKPFYAYGAKATYDGDDFCVGAGYQGHKSDETLYGYAVWGETQVTDNITASAEFGYRQDNMSWWEEDWGWTSEPVAGKGFWLNLDYEQGPVSGSLLYIKKDPFFLVKSWDDDGVGIAREEYMMKEWTGSLIGLTADYDVTRYMNVKLHVDYLVDPEDPRDDRNWGKDYEIDEFYYRVDARYRATLATTLSGWYSSWGETKKVGAGVDYYDLATSASYNFESETITADVTYTFIDDFTGVFEVSKEKGGELAYGVKLKITL